MNEWMNDWDLVGTFLKCPSSFWLPAGSAVIQLQGVSAPRCSASAPTLCLLLFHLQTEPDLLATGHSTLLANPGSFLPPKLAPWRRSFAFCQLHLFPTPRNTVTQKGDRCPRTQRPAGHPGGRPSPCTRNVGARTRDAIPRVSLHKESPSQGSVLVPDIRKLSFFLPLPPPLFFNRKTPPRARRPLCLLPRGREGSPSLCSLGWRGRDSPLASCPRPDSPRTFPTSATTNTMM